jgi:hypothetical protein
MKTLTIILLTLSLFFNGIFLYKYLEKYSYQRGIMAGVERVNRQIIEQVVKNKKLNIKLPKGQSVVMVPQQQQQQEPSQPPPNHVVIEGSKDNGNK